MRAIRTWARRLQFAAGGSRRPTTHRFHSPLHGSEAARSQSHLALPLITCDFLPPPIIRPSDAAVFDVSQAPNGVNFLPPLKSLATFQASVSLVLRLGIANDYLHARLLICKWQDLTGYHRIPAHHPPVTGQAPPILPIHVGDLEQRGFECLLYFVRHT
ncbi:hypothetical protein BST61_g8227 [Cercospora zeina]